MNARTLLLAAAALLAGCSKTSSRPGIRLSGPSAVAVFHAFTARDAATARAYLAVANERGGDLRLLDALDGQAVLAPGLVTALAVPVAPRPALLAAGRLFDDEGAVKRADLLAVAQVGQVACDPLAPTRLSGCIQVIRTWSPATAVEPGLTIELGALLGGAEAEVLSLAILPVAAADGAGGFTPAVGKARLVAGLSGGRLLVADFARAADGVAIALGEVAVHELGFDAVSLSAAPDLVHLYAASPDPVGGVEGVAELDLRGPAALPPGLRPLSAGAPTTQVLAASVRRFVALGEDPALDSYGPEGLMVYAALDPERCGPTRALACGLAVIDPVAGGPAGTGGLAPDPAGELPAHATIAVPGEILGLAAVYPPSLGSRLADGTAAPPGTVGPFQRLNNLGGDRWVSTLAAVTSTTGAVYLVDLGHGRLVGTGPVLATESGTTAAGALGTTITKPPVEGQPYLALWDDRPATSPAALTRDPELLPKLVRLTPGYARSDTFTVSWQGILPQLSALRAQLQPLADGSGPDWLAVQASAGPDAASGPFRAVGRLYHPELGLRPGDIAVVTPLDTAACPKGPFELTVTGLRFPDPGSHPGGAVAVVPRPAADQPTIGGVPADPHCLDGAGRSSVLVTFRAGGLLATGATFGYAGRPAAQGSAADPGWALQWEDPTTLACPMLDGEWPPAAPCDDACRDRCERLLLSRKARREFYVAERCRTTDATCRERWGDGPLVNPPGPALGLKLGWMGPDGLPSTVPPGRGTAIAISTGSGLSASFRRPTAGGQPSGAALPAGLVTFDRAGASGVEANGVRVLVAYPGELVYDFSPSQATAGDAIHR